jgi:hypothetical protein
MGTKFVYNAVQGWYLLPNIYRPEKKAMAVRPATVYRHIIPKMNSSVR